MTAMLRVYFFPNGHGMIDAQGKVLKQSAKGIIRMNVERNDHLDLPFDYYVRLYLTARASENARRAGEHRDSFFSVILLFESQFKDADANASFGVALHEMTHMMFAMVRRLEQRHGEDVSSRFLTAAPWRLLDLRRFKAHRDRLEGHLEKLLKVLPMPVTAAQLAASLVEEAFAYVLGLLVNIATDAAAETKKKGSKVTMVDFSYADTLVRGYVLEKSPQFSKRLNSQAVSQVVTLMKNDVDALAEAIRTHLTSA